MPGITPLAEGVQVGIRPAREHEPRMTTHLTHWIAAHGLVGVFVLMAIDAVLPAGGELVMLVAGALAAGAIAGAHGPSLAAAIVVGAIGYLAGSLAGWAVGRAGGRALIERHGRWLHLGPERFARAERWFERYGAAFVFFGRLTPLLRSFVSIPAGVLEYPLVPYAALTALASLAWCLAFGVAGHALGAHWDEVHRAFKYADYAVIALVAVGVLVLVRRRLGRRTRAGRAQPRRPR
jgi:membrane protein DedA with SNARE-associated domain